MNLLLAATLLLASDFAPNANGAEMRVPVPGLRGIDTANAADVDGAVASRSRRHLQNKNSLGDWALCTDSSECKSQCCSNKYSTSDSRFKCTPVGGFKPNEGCRKLSEWECFLDIAYRTDETHTHEGNVKIWWGHTKNDATWACNNWIPNCGTGWGACYAVRYA
jgi:hypothetical protein